MLCPMRNWIMSLAALLYVPCILKPFVHAAYMHALIREVIKKGNQVFNQVINQTERPTGKRMKNMGYTAVAIRTVRPIQKGYANYKAGIVQIGAARISSARELETFSINIHPNDDFDLNSPDLHWDSGVIKEDIIRESRTFDEALRDLFMWSKQFGTTRMPRYVFYEKKTFEILSNEVSRTGMMTRFKFETKGSVHLYTELATQFNIVQNKNLTIQKAFDCFGKNPPRPTNEGSTVEDDAVNILYLAKLTPSREKFNAFEKDMPIAARADAWREKVHFNADGLTQKKVLKEIDSVVVLTAKRIKAEDGQIYIGQFAATRQMSGNVFPDQSYSQYIKPDNVDLSKAELEDGLSIEDIETKGKPYKTVAYDLVKWLNETKSYEIFVQNQLIIKMIHEMDERLGRNFMQKIFGIVNKDVVCMDCMCASLFPEEKKLYNAMKMCRLLKVDMSPVMNEAFQTRSAVSETQASMIILQAIQETKRQRMRLQLKAARYKRRNDDGFFLGKWKIDKNYWKQEVDTPAEFFSTLKYR